MAAVMVTLPQRVQGPALLVITALLAPLAPHKINVLQAATAPLLASMRCALRLALRALGVVLVPLLMRSTLAQPATTVSLAPAAPRSSRAQQGSTTVTRAVPALPPVSLALLDIFASKRPLASPRMSAPGATTVLQGPPAPFLTPVLRAVTMSSLRSPTWPPACSRSLATGAAQPPPAQPQTPAPPAGTTPCPRSSPPLPA